MLNALFADSVQNPFEPAHGKSRPSRPLEAVPPSHGGSGGDPIGPPRPPAQPSAPPPQGSHPRHGKDALPGSPDAGLVFTMEGPGGTGVVGDRAWLDSNSNGVQDSGEQGLANVPVMLLDGSGMILAWTMTDSQGLYQFSGLAAGTYQVQFMAPMGYQFTLPHQGSDPALDSNADPLTGRTYAFILANGEQNLTIDAGLTTSGSGGQATVTIQATQPNAAEAGPVPGQFTLYRSGGTMSQPLTVNLSVGGTATAGSDYTGLMSGAYIFAANQTSLPLEFTPLDDNLDEGNETVAATLMAGPDYQVGSPSTAMATIRDKDLPVVTISPGTQMVDEGESGGITLSRWGGDIATPLVVNLSLGANGAGDPLAAWGDDYVLTGPEFSYLGAGLATVTFAPGVTTVLLGVPTQTDILAEETEGARVTVQDGGTNYQAGTSGGGTTADVRILNAPVQLNLLADTNVDGAMNAADDALEDDLIGKLLFVNDDDDDADLVRDSQAAGAVAGEDDLALVKLLIPAGDAGMTARLTLTGDTTAVRLWSAPDRTGLISSPMYIAVGPSPISVSVYVEGLDVGFVTLNLELFDAAGDPFVQNGMPAADALRARVAGFDLDVNDDLRLIDQVDGFWDYMPGYRGATPILSSGAFNALTALAPQPLHAIFPGLGSDAGVGMISATLHGTSSNRGYAENAADSGDGFFSIPDVSFSDTADKWRSSTVDNGGMNADKSWINFFVRDYAASANLAATVFDTAMRQRGSRTQSVVRDADGDGLQDGWEAAAVAEFTAQYNIGFNVPSPLQVFKAVNSPTIELADPDDFDNADGGRNLGTHKTQDDSLSVFQEYRGFILDGGGFDGAGQNGHAGGHKRLSPAFKELLVEVDTMPRANVANMPTAANLTTIMEGVTKGFSDRTSGAGIRAYWVVDEANATYQTFSGTQAQVDTAIQQWAVNHRNTSQLGEFVHLSFIGTHPQLAPTNGGYSGPPFGSIIFTGNLPGASNAFYSYLVTHELTHTLLNTKNANGFNGQEHVEDYPTNPPDPPNSAQDAIYIMHEYAPPAPALPNPAPNTNIVFHDLELAQIDLTSKESVER